MNEVFFFHVEVCFGMYVAYIVSIITIISMLRKGWVKYVNLCYVVPRIVSFRAILRLSVKSHLELLWFYFTLLCGLQSLLHPLN